MGRRPYNDPEERLTERLPVMVQADERVDIDSAAWQAGISRSEWCRRKLVDAARRELGKEVMDEGSVA